MIIYWGCASSGTLGGGPEDTDPPVIITSESTQNKQVFFKKKDIVMVFDEFVELKNAAKEIQVSPPLRYRLQTKVRGKKISLSFHDEEELRDSVTYIINFGKAISDFRAGNPLEGHRFVFSTGSYIDSLFIEGVVKDAVSGDAIEGALVMLYDDLRDSVVIEDRPFYFTKTDKSGQFKLENIKSDSFRIYACKDDNGNYVYNQGTEFIGFLPEDFYLDSSNMKNVEILLTKPDANLRLLTHKNEYKNVVDLVFNNPLKEVPFYAFSDSTRHWDKTVKDTLRIWMEMEYDSTFLYLPGFDTLTLYKKDIIKASNLSINPPTNAKQYRFGDTLNYTSNIPLINLNSIDSMSVSDTSGANIEFELTLLNPFVVGLIPEIDSVGEYDIVMPPRQMFDLYGETNDTIKNRISVLEEEDLSSISIFLKGLDTLNTYLIKVSGKTKDFYHSTVSGMDTLLIEIKKMVPEPVNIEVITDLNLNGKWDSASIWGRKQAEPIFNKNIDKPKPNWTVEEDIDISSTLVKSPKDASLPQREKTDTQINKKKSKK